MHIITAEGVGALKMDQRTDTRGDESAVPIECPVLRDSVDPNGWNRAPIHLMTVALGVDSAIAVVMEGRGGGCAV